MKERIRTTLFALAAVMLLAAAMFGGQAPGDGYEPTTREENVSGLAALHRWLDGAGVSVRITELTGSTRRPRRPPPPNPHRCRKET